MLVKWIFVDAAQFYDRFGRLRFRVGVFNPVGDARAFDCPLWVNTQQVAQLYGVWILVGLAGRRRVGQLCMLQDNMQVIRATINLKSTSWFWRHNRILKAVVLHLISSGTILHVAYVPSDLQPADPVSRGDDLHRDSIYEAYRAARRRWDILSNNLGAVHYKGVRFLHH